jgi:hypothetical protein
MSNEETSNEETTTVMDWQEAARIKQADQQARAAGLSQGNKFISFKSGVLSVDKQAAPNNELEVIVLTFCSEHAWYKGKFDPTTAQTPACWAVFNGPEGMMPNPLAKLKQADICSECPKFKWGSDPQGGRGKACKARHRLAVLPGSVNTIEEVEIAPVRFAVLPVTSASEFDKFMSECQMTLNRPIFGVVAKLKVVTDARTQFKVLISPVRPVHSDLMLSILGRINKAEIDIMYDYANFDEEQEEAKPLK